MAFSGEVTCSRLGAALGRCSRQTMEEAGRIAPYTGEGGVRSEGKGMCLGGGQKMRMSPRRFVCGWVRMGG